jgi:hypothetical protein
MTDHLTAELATYRAKLPELLADEGKFALVSGGDVLGVFDSYADALSQGYERVGLKPFLVKKIASFETAAYFTRDMTGLCT